MAYKVIRYHCNFCKRIYASKSYCEKHHEPVCFMNPLRKSCGTCNHLYLYYCNLHIDISIKQKVKCSRYLQIENN